MFSPELSLNRQVVTDPSCVPWISTGGGVRQFDYCHPKPFVLEPDRQVQTGEASAPAAVVACELRGVRSDAARLVAGTACWVHSQKQPVTCAELAQCPFGLSVRQRPF